MSTQRTTTAGHSRSNPMTDATSGALSLDAHVADVAMRETIVELQDALAFVRRHVQDMNSQLEMLRRENERLRGRWAA